MSTFNLNYVTNSVTNTRFAGSLKHFATIDSTNVRAVAAASADAPDGTVFIADEQTAGRGRGGHSWHSAAGDGLYVSAIVRPSMELSEALWISLATGLAAQSALRKTAHLEADIRWPNDLLIGKKKVRRHPCRNGKPSGNAGAPSLCRDRHRHQREPRRVSAGA